MHRGINQMNGKRGELQMGTNQNGMRQFCIAFIATFFMQALVSGDDWPQWRGSNRDGIWAETGLVKKFSKPEIKKKWRVAIGSGYSGPTVAAGRVFVMDRLTEPDQFERVLCFHEETGKPLWKHQYPCEYRNVGYVAGPRASVTVDENLCFSIGTMGHLKCFDVDTGKLTWEVDCDSEYRISKDRRMPIWGIAASPLVYKDLVIVHLGTEGSSLVAFHKKTGKEIWRSLDDRAQYSSPILCRQGEQDVCVIWTGDNVVGINPVDGKPFWKIPFRPRNMPIGIATPIVENGRLFVTSFYDGSLMIRLDNEKPVATEIWRRSGRNERKTEALHSIISTPVFKGEHIYGVDSYGEFRCILAKNGDRVWQDDSAVPNARWSTIHFVENGQQTWMFTERGELIIGELSPDGFKEVSRSKLLDPTTQQLRQRKGVCWSHPAYANRCVFARNDKELVAASLAEEMP